MRPVRLTLAALALAGLASLGLTACGQTAVSAQDAYKVGCPAVDSVLGGGDVANAVTVRGLEALRDSGQLGPEAQAWLDAAVKTLASSDPEDLPPEVKKVVVDGCAQNGYRLQNLR